MFFKYQTIDTLFLESILVSIASSILGLAQPNQGKLLYLHFRWCILYLVNISYDQHIMDVIITRCFCVRNATFLHLMQFWSRHLLSSHHLIYSKLYFFCICKKITTPNWRKQSFLSETKNDATVSYYTYELNKKNFLITTQKMIKRL